MTKVNFRVDGIMILILLVLAALVWLWSKKEKLVSAINPTDPDNVINQAAEAVAIEGDHNGYSYDHHLFAAIDLINPWNESDAYAEQVWGIGESVKGAPGDESSGTPSLAVIDPETYGSSLL